MPPGFLFTDVVGPTGGNGIKLSWVHRSSLEVLKMFSEQISLYQPIQKEDEVLKAVVEDPTCLRFVFFLLV